MEGERHEIGLLMLAVMLRFRGLRTIYLGQDVPDEDLIRTVEDAQPEVLAVGAGTIECARRLPRVTSTLRGTAPRTAVVFGGRVFDAEPGAWPADGAHYGGPDLSSALTLISQLGRTGRPGGHS
jgi:methanogenic corrinoid protein MtbC1